MKEEQLRKEEQKFREIEVRVQREIQEKRQELLAREAQLRDIEARIHQEAVVAAAQQGASTTTQIQANGDRDEK